MRKIETKEEKERKQKRKSIILSLVLVGILVLSTIGYAIFSRHEEEKELRVKIDGRDFFYYRGMWVTQKDGKIFYFNNLPNETKDVFIDDLRGINYLGKKVYFVNSQQPAHLIVNNIKEIELFQEACLDEKCSNEKNLPLKNCSDFLIIFKDSNETKVLKDENCIFLEGDFSKAADAFMYKILRI